jgi:hypothetical protein
MGLWRVLFLAEVDSHPSKSQDLSSGWKVVDLEGKSWRILPAISGRTGSRTKPNRGYSAAISRRLAPWNLNLSKPGPTLLLASAPQRNVPSPAVAWTFMATAMISLLPECHTACVSGMSHRNVMRWMVHLGSLNRLGFLCLLPFKASELTWGVSHSAVPSSSLPSSPLSPLARPCFHYVFFWCSWRIRSQRTRRVGRTQVWPLAGEPKQGQGPSATPSEPRKRPPIGQPQREDFGGPCRNGRHGLH